MKSEANPDDTSQIDKRTLRIRARKRLACLDKDDAMAAGLRVAAHLTAWSGWSRFSALAAFVSLPGEMESRPLIEMARGAGKRVLLPRMTARSTLDFVSVEDLDALHAGRYGVREPSAEKPAEALDADVLIVVPGLAFDRLGGRLGRGAGYYDRTLAHAENATRRRRPLIVGVGFDFQTVERVPMQPHDVRIDGLATESSLVWFD